MARAKTRTRSTGSSERTVGRVLLAALVSWLAYVLIVRFTVAPHAFASWVSGAAAVMTLTVRAGKRR